MQKDVVERLKARRSSRNSVTIDENLKHDIDDAILELQRLRKAVAKLSK
jgi:hypothetical protein